MTDLATKEEITSFLDWATEFLRGVQFLRAGDQWVGQAFGEQGEMVEVTAPTLASAVAGLVTEYHSERRNQKRKLRTSE